MPEGIKPNLPKVKQSLLNIVLAGGMSRDNMSSIQKDEVLDYCLSVAQGALKWGDNVVYDVMGGKNPEKAEELDLDQIDYAFETLKGVKIFPSKERGFYQVFAGDRLSDNEFVLNPVKLPDRKILYTEYPGTTTRKELEVVLKFYKLLD